MSKKIYLFSLVLIALAFTACSETEEASKFDNWRARNEAFMDSLQTVYDTAPDHGGLDYILPEKNKNVKIFYKKKIAKDTGNSPLYTETVTAYYRGYYIFGEKFDENFSGVDPDVNFDQPATFSVQNFYTTAAVSGWADILQNMKVGERWMTYIPWQVAYGSSDKDAIPAYSTLLFDIQLQSIVEEDK
ncbi:FKBP-type peptidyl-prolyl cis-trans isomerase [Bacteroides sp. GM023]|uniref:FKBP-type peptidyl-prolyl cis-trans isomerase n=1 Tax=Bacteroides sp. GM023 TaxID=2723058 RepID=UPI00168A6479|nr:FKBP-type peptidyl-prolyl cis-trans isomerase [Bacteroides sp. GM023]MBD3590921.1 FKBP-type peptidyl-prolyl cis-trans isomerase [Bacteroides sp. GM023]